MSADLLLELAFSRMADRAVAKAEAQARKPPTEAPRRPKTPGPLTPTLKIALSLTEGWTTVAELSWLLGISKRGAQRQLQALRDRGLLETQESDHRAPGAGRAPMEWRRKP